MIRYLHKEGIKIVPWTVNNEEQMSALIEQGVDGLVTDYPDRALKVLHKMAINEI